MACPCSWTRKTGRSAGAPPSARGGSSRSGRGCLGDPRAREGGPHAYQTSRASRRVTSRLHATRGATGHVPIHPAAASAPPRPVPESAQVRTAREKGSRARARHSARPSLAARSPPDCRESLLMPTGRGHGRCPIVRAPGSYSRMRTDARVCPGAQRMRHCPRWIHADYACSWCTRRIRTSIS
jgi:hypothetical protein